MVQIEVIGFLTIFTIIGVEYVMRKIQSSALCAKFKRWNLDGDNPSDGKYVLFR